ncbi:hypothetical protein [Pedobacter aquatilis]|uniref:hypothetical protein n=1 Tax=Pedobacter aquatilis TaxID=351343 RepID=UPI00292E5BBD|nr:hypothetical protein [Pedobacter aquatilis]
MGIIFTLPDSLIAQADFKEYLFVEIEEVDHQHLDQWMDKMIKRLDKDAVNIFLPLVFGSTGTDLLGLRLAMHIRCTSSPFQCANIFIYGTESLNKIREHEFACLFQTAGTALIDYNFHTLKKFAQQVSPTISRDQLAMVMGKIHLEVPKNYYDSHSIANIWGMHRLLELAQIAPSSVASLNSKKNQLYNIYFKWLLVKNSDSKIINDEVVEVKKQYAQRLSGLKIIRKIDLK